MTKTTGMEFKARRLNQISKMICGDSNDNQISYFIYRSSFYLTEFFGDAETEFAHDGSTRPKWVAETLREILKEPCTNHDMPSDTFCRVIETLMDQSNAFNEDKNRSKALEELNNALSRTTLLIDLIIFKNTFARLLKLIKI